ncbi:hypothetical protein [Streptomyces sp. NPDC056401]|uniref:hypothetical protein n=1 Tax=Streptomyces sp. NPDC056401 TaxID=3345809 RepID=UPI0035DC5DDA
MPLIDVHQLADRLVLEAAAQPAGPVTDRSAPSPSLPNLPGSTVRALATRTAVRSWAPEPLDGGLLHRALAYAAAHDAAQWGAAFPDDPAPTAAVLVKRVAGLRSGFHLYDTRSGELTFQEREVPDHAELVLQLEFGDAPVLVLVLGDMAGALAREGAAGHRRLLSRGAAFAHSAWLSALSEGAAGTVFAGVLSSAARTHLGVDGYRQAQLLGLALGTPAEEGSPS